MDLALKKAERKGKPVRGASTITNQCARSIFLWQGRSWMRKGLESYYTIWMEALLPKRRIMELYANVIEMGRGIYGVEPASQHSFGPLAFPLLSCRIMKKLNHAPNLTQRPPRSPRVRLGGYVVLPRILDKGRAEIAGTAGEFKYNNPGDYHWFRFTGITPEALKAELATGKGDAEMLAWIQENAPNKRSPWEIQQWSAYFSERGPDSDVETLEMFADRMKKFNPAREDVKTWFDLLDLDDHVTFGGKA
jgi:hypothetical protein